MYIFGGHGSLLSQVYHNSRVCEKFHPTTLAIERLPDMCEPRAAFGVCWHLHLVYICGGTSTTIERFDPANAVFTNMGDIGEMVFYV